MSQKEDYEKLKQRILKLGIVIPGTIRETYLVCGKENCKCIQSANDKHGPYYFWNRKIGAKLTSKSLNPELLHHYEEWLSNRRHLEKLVGEMLDFGLNYATSFKPGVAAEKRKK